MLVNKSDLISIAKGRASQENRRQTNRILIGVMAVLGGMLVFASYIPLYAVLVLVAVCSGVVYWEYSRINKIRKAHYEKLLNEWNKTK